MREMDRYGTAARVALVIQILNMGDVGCLIWLSQGLESSKVAVAAFVWLAALALGNVVEKRRIFQLRREDWQRTLSPGGLRWFWLLYGAYSLSALCTGLWVAAAGGLWGVLLPGLKIPLVLWYGKLLFETAA